MSVFRDDANSQVVNETSKLIYMLTGYTCQINESPRYIFSHIYLTSN
jgi:hypothetical protein